MSAAASVEAVASAAGPSETGQGPAASRSVGVHP
jgi:hypothetical protein